MNDAVTYTIKVLSTQAGEDGRERRTVLFRRTSGGESIEISAETDAPNLLAHLPELLDAAMELRTVGALPEGSPRLAAESRLLRWLTLGGEPGEGRRERSPGGQEGAYPQQP